MILDGWIPVSEWCLKNDVKIGVVHKRISDGVWERGDIYAAPEGGTGYVHEERAAEWLRVNTKLKPEPGTS